ncbi:MAG TPA: iron-containing alcohol dehydrogenase [Phycisphaerae bacterium]|nr:iron-containing alcohol dehydrogenase [Phycisphaerae bacterium]HOJ74407.1 iron-containing alcohol dehydrogenase [Phycisphaerae bacterium]HOM52896.1 iron-containing alcohol dehydrogenase [Phycisphaerae bacterium]HON68611.1 iron-containing alcohol dehydrogenase [Phycisphaerae bacterium]HOQ85757.1 iron-containing alcohol dehydrogenase [Phycisphaerae bacterium]
MPFEFATAGRIVFGSGVLEQAGRLACEILAGSDADARALLVTGKDTKRADGLRAVLDAADIECLNFVVPGEPTVELARVGAQLAMDRACGLVVGLGGGSAIDAGKAIAALAANPGDPLDYLEVIGRGQALAHPSLPYIAIPTTAGTGAEVTRNAVLRSEEHGVKVSLRSPHMLPRVALVDPQLTLSMPPAVTASTGLDALTQLIEPFVSVRANPLTDAICLEGIACVARSLRRAYQAGDDLDARADMSLAGLFGGLALANAGLGAVHGFAGPIGGMYPAPHGAVCAALLPHVMASNVRALRQRQPDSPSLERYGRIARIVTGRAEASIEDGVEWVARLVADLNVPSLRAYDIEPANADAIVEKSMAASSMKGNPIVLTRDELREVLLAAL